MDQNRCLISKRALVELIEESLQSRQDILKAAFEASVKDVGVTDVYEGPPR